MDRLIAAVKSRGATIFARIDHAAAAAEAGLSLESTEVLIFGSPRAGTLLMQSTRTIAIDLPLKALVWRDASGKCWLAYDDPEWLAERHHLDDKTGDVRKSMAAMLTAVSNEATKTNDILI
jgi:uncharacterized protein (DUF302 family)